MACAADGTVFAATEGTTDRRSRALWHWKVGAAKELSLQLVDQEVKDKTQPGLNYGGALSPDGSSFAWPTADGKTLRILDASSGMEIRRIEGAPFGLGLVRFAGDGRALTTASPDGTGPGYGRRPRANCSTSSRRCPPASNASRCPATEIPWP